MKKFFTFLFLLIAGFGYSQIEGVWYLANQPAALGVGPNLGDMSWWSNSAGDVTTRACLFDDSVTFDTSNNFANGMGSETWLEAWQGVAAEQCGAPVAPHNDATGTYTYDSGTGQLTINGVGAHIGLAKVFNGGELADPANAPASITYDVSFSPDGNTLTADINFGAGWWRFIYQRSGTTAGPSTYDVTFNVDMSDYAGTFTQVYMSGSFNGWCGDCNAMVDAGGGIWKLTLPLSAGAMQYKFTMDNWAAQEEFVGGEPCTITDGGFTNRYLDVTESAMLPVVCFESCEACPGGTGSESNVTFNVDMSQYAGSFTTVYVSGSFNNWCGDCDVLNDAGSGLWKGTFPLTVGVGIEYKFTMDNWAAQEEFAGGESCTITTGGFTNRYYLVVTGDPSISVVCFESCDPCSVGLEETTETSFSVVPNPFNSEIEIVSDVLMNNVRILDMSGKEVFTSISDNKNMKLNLDFLNSGVYTIVVEGDESISTRRIIKK